MSTQRYLMGIDGGGSTVRVAIVTLDGASGPYCISRAIALPINSKIMATY
jgi:N-acetylglucosamine kinase-like BadF-type ATPase